MLDKADSVVIGGAFRWRWSWRMGMGKFVERIGTKKGRMGWEDVLDGVYHFCFWVHEKSRVFLWSGKQVETLRTTRANKFSDNELKSV